MPPRPPGAGCDAARARPQVAASTPPRPPTGGRAAAARPRPAPAHTHMWLRPPSPVRLRDELCPSRHPTLYPSLRGCTGPPQEVARSLDGYSLPAARPRRGSFLPAVVQHPSSPRCAPSASTPSTSSEAGYHGSTVRGQLLSDLGRWSVTTSRDGRRRIPSSETRGSTSYSWKRKQQELEEAGEGGLAHPARPRDLQLLRGLCPCGPQLLQRLLHHPSLLSPGYRE